MDSTQHPPPVVVRLADWPADEAALSAVRRQVFVVEQGVPEELEIDGLDPRCVHVIAWHDAAGPVGAARLDPDAGKIGRVAVLPTFRRHGIGARLVRALIEAARARGLARVRLHAQVDSLPFYEVLGFAADGPVFDEAGIPHRRMTRPLD